LFYFILFCFTLSFSFILFYYILFCFIFVLFSFILFCSVLLCVLFYFILFYFILFYFVLFYFILVCFTLLCFILFYFISFYFCEELLIHIESVYAGLSDGTSEHRCNVTRNVMVRTISAVCPYFICGLEFPYMNSSEIILGCKVSRGSINITRTHHSVTLYVHCLSCFVVNLATV
jgi:hypothetical protein